jgi:xylose isomerase
VETLYWLDRCGYKAWLSMDQYPYREEAAEAIGESILWLRQFDEIVQRNRPAIDALLKAGDPVKTSKFLRTAWVPAGG